MSKAEEEGSEGTPNISDVEFGDDEVESVVKESVSGGSGAREVPVPPMAIIPGLYKSFLDEQQNALSDPPETPYKSKYEARKYLRELHGLLATELELGYNATDTAVPSSTEGESTAASTTADQDRAEPAASEEVSSASAATAAPNAEEIENMAGAAVNLKMPRNILNILLGHVHLQLGVNYSETEQNSEGERNLLKAYKFLVPYRSSSECVLAFVSVCNQLGYLLSNRMEHKQALPYLTEAEQVFRHYTINGEGLSRVPCGVHQMFLPSCKPESANMELVKGHTHTLYFLAQVYKHLDHTDLAAHYCMATLQRQLSIDNHDPHDWALNCGTLSCFFLSQHRYKDALYCLAASTCMLAKHSTKKDDKSVEGEAMAYKAATVSRLWTAYAMELLEDSRKEIVRKANLTPEEIAAEEAAAKAKEEAAAKANGGKGDEEEEEEEDSKDPFAGGVKFQMEGTEEYTKGVPDAFISTFDEARQLFLLGQRHVEQSKAFFTLDEHCTDYVELVQSHSTLYNRLAFFEKDQDRVCKMHRRRADMLMELAGGLNPQYYLAVVRQLCFAAAEAIISLLDIKLDNYERVKDAGQVPDMKLVKKVNMLILQAKSQFDAFIASLNDPQGKVPEMFSEDVARPALLCKFHVARLHSKLIVTDKASSIANLKQSLKLHTDIVEYCAKYPDAARLFENELEISKDMMTLLPQHLDKMASAK